uniref:Heat shock protein 70 n=1 Tax=Panagrolaimus superbus TaxID=310955 RepID=A0A914Z1I7_9BILA
MESIMNKFTSLTTFNQPNYKQTSAYFTSKITNTVADEVSDCIGLDFDIRRALSLNPISAIGLPYQITKELEFKGSNNTTIPLVRVMAIMIAAIKEKLEKALNEEIKNVVLTIPTSFGIQQQQILVDACQIANLKVVKLLFEPVATAITYYSIKKSEKKIICIIDFGGGKLDVANFVIENGRIELLNSATDLELGGRDFDEKLVNYVVGILKRKYPNIVVNDRVMTRIREKCILGKESLTTFSQKSIELDDIGDDDVTINITRIEFETICNDLFKRALSLISRVTNSIDKTRINDVVLVGGSSRMPKFQTDLKQIFPNIPFNVTLNADEAIAKGAAIYGASLTGCIKKLTVIADIPWDHKPPGKGSKMKTFIDESGKVRRQIIDDESYTSDIEKKNHLSKKL